MKQQLHGMARKDAKDALGDDSIGIDTKTHLLLYRGKSGLASRTPCP